MQVFKAGKPVCFLLAQAQKGILWGVTEGKATTKDINSKANIHASFSDFSRITYE